MNILLINHYAGNPHYGMEYRPYYLAREWVRQGHNVTIVGADFSHLRRTNPVADRALAREEVDGIEYRWLRSPKYDGNGGGRVLNMFSFVAQMLFYGRRIGKLVKPDLVIASSTYPLDIFPAKRIAAQCGAKLCFEVHDLWPLSPIELGGMSPRHPFIMLLQYAENWAYRTADKVVSMLPKALEHMMAHGMAREKFAYVPNGIDVDEWRAPEQPPDLPVLEQIDALKRGGARVVGYTGSHGPANAMDNVLLAARLLGDRPVVFVLVGDGSEKRKLLAMKTEFKLDNVHFFDPVPKQSIPALLEKMDVVFIGSQRVPIYRFGVSPNKMMDYMMAAKPIIQAIESGNDPVGEAGCGLTISPGDPAALVQAIESLLALSDEERAKMGQNGRRFVLENHTYPVLAQRFIDACR
ncbi:glycosyltransferase family 4 protein [Janthinobacterium sp. LB2P49]|uniref:glycosyltransferase family 4 protein n=1 Tax=Janthinobacterium sp. LB2P49 TaxID=3424198 RepID=UPI003F2350E6